MKVCFLITGIPRRFSKYLRTYLQNLEEYLDFDIYLYFPKENCEENYANEIFHNKTFIEILENPRYKLLLLDTQVPSLPERLSRKQKNCLIQWYRIHKCFQFVSDKLYDVVIRLRPDVDILMNPTEFVSMLEKSLEDNCIHIPIGYNEQSSVNDQIAFGPFAVMKDYCLLYTSIDIDACFSSDMLLESYLEQKHLLYKRVALSYKLSISDCKVIAIAGDSASGKSTLMTYIQDLMPKDSSLCVETDSYHKWERHDERWKDYTHLHPEANHLERMSEDVLRLKIGENVAMVDYDHLTGKFTQQKITKGKPFILFCGLHTLYTKSILNDLDIKIFLDTQDSLKYEWKIKRDTLERNHSLDKVLASIERRKQDSQEYILPQKEHANFIIEYKLDENDIVVDVILSPYLSSILHPFQDFFSLSSSHLSNGMISYRLRTSSIESNTLYLFLQQHQHRLLYLPPSYVFQDNTTGILQLMIFLLLFYEYE